MGGVELTGQKEFLEVFGGITVSQIVYVIMAIVFLVLVYRKVSDYLYKRHDAEQEKDKQLKETLEAVSHYPEYRKQSMEIQQQLTKEMKEIKDTLKNHTERLEKMENDSKKREVNKLRETLLQNYKYYTSKEKNPMQAWTKMESEAFWDLFTDYEDMGGNGYMHTVVQPAMLLLTVIEINDVEGISELMKNRK